MWRERFGEEEVQRLSSSSSSSSFASNGIENPEEQSIYYSTLLAIENIMERLHTYRTAASLPQGKILSSFQPARIVEPILITKLEECNFMGVVNNIVNNRDSYGDAAADLAVSIMDEYFGW
jgi:hypothetical protein